MYDEPDFTYPCPSGGYDEPDFTYPCPSEGYDEPDFTYPCPSAGYGFDPESRSVSPQSMCEDDLPPHPGYTIGDMNPTVRDPRCTSSNAKLACFWPVYVGNFKADRQVDNAVKLYFASRRLHVRWWIQRTNDPYYMDFQSKAGIYDMLVYFVSERDANYAIKRCHRDTFNGFTLNVFPGRSPVYFDPARSVYAEKMKSGRVFSEQFFERHIKRYGVVVDCVVKFDMRKGALEFARPGDVAQAQKMERMWTYLPVTGMMQKQRFLEGDLIREIEAHLARWPNTLEPNPNDKYMNKLLQGNIPYVDANKWHRVQPLRNGPSKRTQQRRFEKKKEKLFKRAMKSPAGQIQLERFMKKREKRIKQKLKKKYKNKNKQN